VGVMKTNTSDAANTVKKWLERVVVDLNLCPFARPVVQSEFLRIVTEPGETAACLEAVARECEFLHQNSELETSLIVLESNYFNFDNYLELTATADDLLHALGFDGIFQLASFHPDYQFADSDASDVENYTNRSPFPILHLLRESSVTRAVESYDGIDTIPERNMQTMRDLGLVKVQKLLDECYV